MMRCRHNALRVLCQGYSLTVIYIGLHSERRVAVLPGTTRKRDLLSINPLLSGAIQLKHLYEAFKPLHELLSRDNNRPRNKFRQVEVNFQYRAKAIEELKRLDQLRFRALVDGRDQEQILDKLNNLANQASKWDYKHSCHHLLADRGRDWNCFSPRPFIILPLDLGSWNDLESSTHQFRLYFGVTFGAHLILQSICSNMYTSPTIQDTSSIVQRISPRGLATKCYGCY